MTLLFVDSFDAQDTAAKWLPYLSGSPGAVAYTTPTRLGSGYAVTLPDAVSTTAYGIMRSFTASSQVFCGAALKLGTASGQGYTVPFLALAADAGTTWHLYLVATASGAVQLWRGDGRPVPSAYSTAYVPAGTMAASSAGGILDGNWHYVEVSATLNSTTGAVTVRVDGSTVISFTGNTRNGGTSTSIDTLAAAFGLNAAPGAVVGAPSVDDLYVCNALGAVNNTFLGDVRIQALLPAGAGSSTALTPTGSGSNYANVNEVPDSTATYNSSATSGNRDTYTMTAPAAGTGAVLGVQQVTVAAKSGAGTASLKAAQKSGSTVSYGAVNSLGTGFGTYLDVFETNPATGSAYTAAALSGIEAGAEVV